MNLKLEVKTLTPLWTGGVKTGHMDRIHETGIIGSLRWWYEAIVRGLGGDVCDPTSDRSGDRCPRNGDNYCQVCRLFGATGWRRAFRLRLGAAEALLDDRASNILIPSGRIDRHRRNRPGGWYLMSDSVTGEEIPLRIIALSSTDAGVHLRPVLALIHRYAAVGAKVSNGYGVVHFCENGQAIQVGTLDDLFEASQSPRRHTLPDVRDFFFAKFRFHPPTNTPDWWKNVQGVAQSWRGKVSDGQRQAYVHSNRRKHQQAKRNLEVIVQDGLLPLAPAIRNWLRYHWTSGLNDCQKYYLFGEARPVCPYCCQTNYKTDRNDRRRNWCFDCRRTFAKEVINPHDRATRAGKLPIYFESVPAGAEGVFSLLYVPFDDVEQETAQAELTLIAVAIKEMMLTYGFSAKKSSGFGEAEDEIEGQIVTTAGANDLRRLTTLEESMTALFAIRK